MKTDEYQTVLELEMEISDLRETIKQRESRIYELFYQMEELRAELAKLA